MIMWIVYTLNAATLNALPKQVLDYMLLELYVGCGSLNQPYLLNPHLSAILHGPVRTGCLLIRTGDNPQCLFFF